MRFFYFLFLSFFIQENLLSNSHIRMRVTHNPHTQSIAKQCAKTIAASGLAAIANRATQKSDDIQSIGFDPRRLVCPSWCNGFSKEQFERLLAFIYNDDIARYQQSILQLHQYYQHDGFIELICEFTGYENYLTNLYNDIHNSSTSHLAHWWQGLNKSRVDELYEQLRLAQWQRAHDQQAAKEAARRAQERMSTEKIITQRLEQQADDLEALYHEYHEAADGISAYHRKRAELLGSYFNSTMKFFEQKHGLTAQGQSLLQRAGYEKEIQELPGSFVGNRLQHHAYQECTQIINHLGAITESQQRPLNNLEELTISVALLGCQASRAGHIKQAYQFADVGWAALECLKGFAQGIADGVIATAHAALHPIETIHDMAQSVTTAGYYLGKALYEIGDLSATLCMNPDQGLEKCSNYYTAIATTCTALAQHIKNTPPRDLVRSSVSCVTQGYLTGKCMGAAHKFFKSAATSARKLAEHLRNGEQIAVTAEGVSVQIAHEAGQVMAKMETAEKLPQITGIQFTKHSLERLIERGITRDMIEITIKKGLKFYDSKNNTLNYVLKNGFASGKDLLVGTNPFLKKITTVIRGNKLINRRFIPIQRS